MAYIDQFFEVLVTAGASDLHLGESEPPKIRLHGAIHPIRNEPLTQEEYYSLQALFFPVYNADKWTKPNDRVVSVGTKDELAVFKRRNDLINKQVKAANGGLKSFADSLRAEMPSRANC